MLAPDILLASEEQGKMMQPGEPGQDTTNRPPHIGTPPEDEEEKQRKLLDLRIGLALLGEEERKQLLQYARTLRLRSEEQTTMRGRMPSA
jgi:hypothetical protein